MKKHKPYSFADQDLVNLLDGETPKTVIDMLSWMFIPHWTVWP